MHPKCLDYCLTEEARKFKRDGYFIVPDALPSDMVRDLVVAVDRIDKEERARMGKSTTAAASIVNSPFTKKDRYESAFLFFLSASKSFFQRPLPRIQFYQRLNRCEVGDI